MRNINLIYNKNIKIDCEDVVFMAVDPNKPNTSYLSSESTIFQLDYEDNRQIELFGIPNIIAIEYLALNNEFCIATKAGEVVLYNINASTEEVVTFCDGGIANMVWSPDQEVATFVTDSLNVVVMNSNYDVIAENSLKDYSVFGDQAFVTVNWGKKETQFHGSEGKQAALKKDEVETQNLDTLSRNITISWRGDGEYFAVGFLGQWGRMFKVYNKEGSLQFTSEKCAGLDYALAWMPSGRWIAIPQVFPNKYTIAFFEKNGLRHRELVLPFKESDELVKSLSWSLDSDILMIETVRLADNSSTLYFYTICNYHWYMKQCLKYKSLIKSYEWDKQISQSKTLHIMLSDGTYSIYRWDYLINRSVGHSDDDEALVAVIDGCNILLTNFKGVVVPPPMAGLTLTCSNPINFIGFLNITDRNNYNTFITVDSENQCIVYKCEFTGKAVNHLKTVDLITQYKVDVMGKDIPMYFNHFVWIKDDLLIFTSCHDNITSIYLSNISKSNETLNIEDEIQMKGCVANLSYNKKNSIFVHFSNGTFSKVELLDEKFKISEDNITEVSVLGDEVDVINENNLITFTKNKQILLYNDIKIATDATSYFVTEKFLAYTTLNQVKFIKLQGKDITKIIYERRIERGSKLVIIVPNDSKTVFQLPRGNLEVIHPRLLSLDIIGDFLKSRRYSKAFDIFRKQRINLNLLIDHDPEAFLNNLEYFINDIDNTNWLNLFLSDLQNEDVTRTMYGDIYENVELKYPADFKIANKVDYVCNRIIELLKDNNKYIQPLITCYWKKSDLEKALEIIWDLKKSETDDVHTGSEGALKYLLYLVDVNELYNVALGMYDFGLVLFVANKSQKDPKEYLPFLNELKAYDESYKRFKIDCFLQRFSKSIESIAQCSDDKFDECLEIVKQHNLYAKAMSCYKDNIECYRTICKNYGDFLRTNGKLTEASLIYEKAGDYQQAVASARNILDWRRCITLSRAKGSSDDDIKISCLSLVPALREQEKYLEAAEIVKRFDKNENLLIEILIQGKLYAEAILEAHFTNSSIIDDIIKPEFQEHLKGLTKSIVEDDLHLYIKHKNRLLVVRDEKIKKKMNNHLEEGNNDVDDCDLYSDTTSVVSSKYTSSSKGSGKSFRSSKNRRKHEKKLLNLKEGNQFEDIALIDVLYKLVIKICSTEQQNSIREMCKVAIELDYINEGEILQKSYSNLLHIVKQSLDEIWIPELMVAGQVPQGPEMNFEQVQAEQYYSMIKPLQRFKPDLPTISWEFDVLK